jgi:hypothetical protein
VELYELDAYSLEHLPAWDGRDHVTAFAQRVPTADALWLRFFPVWMRSMVAHWLGKDSSIKVGKILVGMGCEGHRGNRGNAYQVVVQEK